MCSLLRPVVEESFFSGFLVEISSFDKAGGEAEHFRINNKAIRISSTGSDI
jgi:hypothetical protein